MNHLTCLLVLSKSRVCRGLYRTTTRALIAALVTVAAPVCADAATRYVTVTGVDGPSCGSDPATACRSITQAIVLAAPGDTVLVGPGLYGDLNRSGVLGDMPGEETGSAGCGCAVSINKPVIVVSSGGAAATLIDARKVYLIQNVLLITVGGEFGRPGKGFTVTETVHNGYKSRDSLGIVIDSVNVKVRGNRVIHTTQSRLVDESVGILPVNNEFALIEGNQVIRFSTGIGARGNARVSRNQVLQGRIGFLAGGGDVTGNVATQNTFGFLVSGAVKATGNAASFNKSVGFEVFAAVTGALAKNNMIANGGDGTNCGLTNDGIAGLNAANNYWGAAEGPGAPPANAACLSGTTGWTITNPYATKPFVVKVVKP